MSSVLPHRAAAARRRTPMPARRARARCCTAPLLPTLLRLATPNVIGLFAMTVVIGYDGFLLGKLGADALAGIALVFPLSMLMLQMSAGGIGGATTAAVARALGAGRPTKQPPRAAALLVAWPWRRCSCSACSASGARCTRRWAAAARRSMPRSPTRTSCSRARS